MKWIGAALIWLLLVSVTYLHGFNYSIYTYNADLTLAGQQAYGRPGPHWIGSTSPHYLDYPGLQHLVYVVLRATDTFKLYTVIMASLAAWLLYRTHGKRAALLMLHPMLFYALLNQWEDKLLFIVIPLVVLWLIEHDRWRVAALIIGLSCALNGMLFFSTPLVIWHYRRRWLLFTGYLVLGFGVGMLPFFPDALWGWRYRAERMAIGEPFWWSIWLPLRDLYTPNLDRLAVIGVAFSAFYGFVTGRLSLRAGLAWSLAPVLVLGVYNGYQRFGVFMVVALALAGASSSQYRIAWMLMLSYFPLRTLSPSLIQPVHVVLFYLPLLALFPVNAYTTIQSTMRPARFLPSSLRHNQQNSILSGDRQ